MILARPSSGHKDATRLIIGWAAHIIDWAAHRKVFFTPTKKPTGYTADSVGRRQRLYGRACTPYQRLIRIVAAKTRTLEAAVDVKKALPDPVGIKIRKPSA